MIKKIIYLYIPIFRFLIKKWEISNIVRNLLIFLILYISFILYLFYFGIFKFFCVPLAKLKRKKT